ncbi:MAG: hypothetical protein J6S85_08385 [Methanobrevibacter sp.]|nr:hypothetical protein [Methanobrevibacter sp.]
MNCKVKTNNTAESRCKLELGLYRRVILLPLGARFTGLDENNQDQTIEEWIEAGIHAAEPENRFYPMPLFTNCEDNSEDNTEWTNGYGTTYVVREGAFAFTQNFERDVCLTRRLLDFNGQTFRALIVDNQNNIQGVQLADGFTGETCSVWVSQPKANSASEFSEPSIRYSFTNPDEHKKREIRQSDLAYGDIKGLEDVKFVDNGNDTFQIVTADCGNIDVTAELSALSGETTAWLKDGANPTTAPTYSAGSFSIPASGDWSLADPSVLYGLGVANKAMDEETELTKN